MSTRSSRGTSDPREAAAADATAPRRSLRVASPCTVFRPSPGNSLCPQCDKHVHDLSALTRGEADALLDANKGQTMCIAYRVAKDGTVIHRAEPRSLAIAAAALGSALVLAACAPHGPDVAHPEEPCRDPLGYEQDCNAPRPTATPVIPDTHHNESTPPPAPVDNDNDSDNDDDDDDDAQIVIDPPEPEKKARRKRLDLEDDIVGLMAMHDPAPAAPEADVVGEFPGL